MEVTVLIGKRKNSSYYYVNNEKQIYLNHERKCNALYVKCYHKSCSARGKIIDNIFRYTTNNIHLHDENSPTCDEVLALTNFFNEIKKNAGADNPKNVYDNSLLR